MADRIGDSLSYVNYFCNFMEILCMQRATRFIYKLLKNTFLVSVIGLLTGWLAGTDNWFGSFFGAFGLYCAMLTFYIFIAHVLLVALTFIFKNSKTGQ
jgi:uncharacterized membrane protein